MSALKHRKIYQRIEKLVDELTGGELELVRTELVANLASPELSLQEYAERVAAMWSNHLNVDRIFMCDAKNGDVVVGWNRGKNIIKLSDWDPDYVPLEDDKVLQEALEGNELVAAAVEGEGADLAFSIRFANNGHWLAVLDDTTQARYFTHMEMAHIRLGRDLIALKSAIG